MSPAQTRISRRALVAGGAAAAGGTLLAAVVGRHGPPDPPKLASRMTASYREGEIPLDDPQHWKWRRTPGILAALQPQQIAAPILHEAALETLEIRALHDGGELAFLLEWDDPERDDLNGIGRFQDAVAIQLPTRRVNTPPPITMGSPGTPVHILQWRASWQRDIERGRAGPRVLYPRLVLDIAPDELLGAEAAAPYTPARAVGNPLSVAKRTSAIEEIVAEGFGSATTLQTQRARGAGVYAEGRWGVTVALPLERGDAGEAIAAGSVWPVAFAVWLGSRGNRGARKHFADWVSCEIEAA
jgi:hypothetical protein